MQESFGLGRPSVGVVAEFSSTVVLAVLSLTVWFLTRRRADPNGGIWALVVRGRTPTNASRDRSDFSQGIFTSQALIFDCLWILQVLVAVVPGIALFGLGYQGEGGMAFALVLGVYRTLSERMNWIRLRQEPRGRMKVSLAAAGSVVMLGGLVTSVVLTQHNVGPTVVLAERDMRIGGKTLVLLLVSSVHLWSCLECLVLSGRDGWKSRQIRVWACCVLATSILPMAVWATLLTDRFEDFLVIVYFSCVPGELLWSGCILWLLWRRWGSRGGQAKSLDKITTLKLGSGSGHSNEGLWDRSTP